VKTRGPAVPVVKSVVTGVSDVALDAAAAAGISAAAASAAANRDSLGMRRRAGAGIRCLRQTGWS
jgi:hypothetical protein